MKKSLRLFFGASFLASAGVVAQPTLTAAGTNIVIGDQLIESNASYVSPGSAGANQTWNLSAMTTSSTATVNVVHPDSTANGASFPNANVAADRAGVVGYYNATGTSFENYGNFAGGITVPYTNPEDLLHFPFTYNDSYTDNFTATFVAGGSTVYRVGTCTVTADGYGTVTTPAGTYTNALRIHLVEAYQDSSNIFGTPYISTYNNDQYMWYDNNRHWAIASVFSYTTTLSGTTQGGTFYGAPVGIRSNAAFDGAVKVYPNPATAAIKVKVELEQNQRVELRLFNSLGEQVAIPVSARGVRGENVYQLDVSLYTEGIYFMQMWVNGTLSATRRFAVAR